MFDSQIGPQEEVMLSSYKEFEVDLEEEIISKIAMPPIQMETIFLILNIVLLSWFSIYFAHHLVLLNLKLY
jgi:hypothetical protein